MNRPCPCINKSIKQDYRMLLRLFNSANKFSRKYNKTLASMIANNSDSIYGEYIGTSDKEIDEALLIPF